MKADAPATAAQGFGNVVHVLADEVASGRTPADLDVLMERLDSVWNALAFDAPWKSAQEKENARVALERFLKWHVMDRTGRTPVASEHDFDVTLESGDYQVRIRGQMDRVEADGEGRAYVVDFKTGKQAPSSKEVERHPSSPCTSSPSARAPSTRSSTGCAPSRAAPSSSSCGRAPPNGTAARPCPRCRRRNRWRGVGRRPAGDRRRQGPRRALHPDRGPALRALRVPGVVQRPPRGPPRRRVNDANGVRDVSHHPRRPALLPARRARWARAVSGRR